MGQNYGMLLEKENIPVLHENDRRKILEIANSRSQYDIQEEAKRIKAIQAQKIREEKKERIRVEQLEKEMKKEPTLSDDRDVDVGEEIGFSWDTKGSIQKGNKQGSAKKKKKKKN